MRPGVMLSDVLQSLFKAPATRRYPFEQRIAPERLRGKLLWENSRCTGCGLCVKECPSDAIEIEIIDRAAKRFVFHYRADRCTFCAQCVQNCRFRCLALSNKQWEMAALNKEDFDIYYGNASDIQAKLEKAGQAGATDQSASEPTTGG